MFFPDTGKSLSDMLRVLRPGGRIALAVWHQRKNNPIHELFMGAVEQLLPIEPLADDAPDAFRYADEGKLASLVKNAGFSNMQEHTVDLLMQTKIDFERFFEFRAEISDSFRQRLKTLSSAQKDWLYDDLRTKFDPYLVSGELKIPGKIILVTAQK